MAAIPTFGLGWRVLFLIFLVAGVLSTVLLGITHVDEEPSDSSSSFVDCVKLLSRPIVLLCFLGIICHVGIDVGTNTTAPKILMERLGWTLNEAAFATSLYFIFRTAGCLTGSLIMRVVKPRIFFAVSAVMMVASMVLLFVGTSSIALYVAIALVGFGNSNVFPIIFSQALVSVPDRKNEVSGLMIMGLFGGTIFPLLMGFATDACHLQAGAVAVMAIGVVYLILFTKNIKQ